MFLGAQISFELASWYPEILLNTARHYSINMLFTYEATWLKYPLNGAPGLWVNLFVKKLD